MCVKDCVSLCTNSKKNTDCNKTYYVNEKIQINIIANLNFKIQMNIANFNFKFQNLRVCKSNVTRAIPRGEAINKNYINKNETNM